MTDYTFRNPPGWPEPPSGWVPPKGWKPDPSWPPAPKNWQFFEELPFTTGEYDLDPRDPEGWVDPVKERTAETRELSMAPRVTPGERRLRNYPLRWGLALIVLGTAGANWLSEQFPDSTVGYFIVGACGFAAMICFGLAIVQGIANRANRLRDKDYIP